MKEPSHIAWNSVIGAITAKTSEHATRHPQRARTLELSRDMRERLEEEIKDFLRQRDSTPQPYPTPTRHDAVWGNSYAGMRILEVEGTNHIAVL